MLRQEFSTPEKAELCVAMSVNTSQTYVSKPHTMCKHTDESIYTSETSETFNFKIMCNTPKASTKVDLLSEYVRKHDAKDSNQVNKIKRH